MTKRLKVEVCKDRSSQSPILCTIPSSINEEIGISIFKRKSSLSSANRAADQKFYAHAEDDKMEYLGDNLSLNMPCKYLLAMPSGDRLIVQEAPIVFLSQSVKSISAGLEDSKIDRRVSEANKRALGETFGTRKALSAIKSYDRGKIDVSTLASVSNLVSQSIDSKAALLESQDDIKRTTDEHRLIPPYDAETADISKVYPIDNILPANERKQLSVDEILGAGAAKIAELIKAGKYSKFVGDRLQNAISRNDRTRLGNLLFLDYLIKFRGMRVSQLNKKSEFMTIMEKLPLETEVRLFSLFTEKHPGMKAGSTCHKISKSQEHLLVAYICTLALHIEGFTVELAHLSKDLSLSTAKISDHFRQLGCTVESRKGDKVSSKVARLVAPVVFPKIRMLMK